MTQAGESAQCDVHGERMQRRAVAIQYGLVALGEGYWEALADLFPNADEPAMGGCCISPDMPMDKSAYVCEACCKARDAWHAAHPRY